MVALFCAMIICYFYNELLYNKLISALMEVTERKLTYGVLLVLMITSCHPGPNQSEKLIDSAGASGGEKIRRIR